jgi:hypothetical protein
MARLTESQLAGFRTGTTTNPDRPTRRAPEREKAPQGPGTEQPSLALAAGAHATTSASLGPVPPAPARSDPRHKIGLTLPADLAADVRSFLQRGYALADLVMVAYRNHRDDLVNEHTTRTTRQLEPRKIGRASFTITVSTEERDALDALARHLDTTRSQTVAAIIQRHLTRTDVPSTHTEPSRTPRSEP